MVSIINKLSVMYTVLTIEFKTPRYRFTLQHIQNIHIPEQEEQWTKHPRPGQPRVVRKQQKNALVTLVTKHGLFSQGVGHWKFLFCLAWTRGRCNDWEPLRAQGQR